MIHPMSPDFDPETVVEAVARAMCEADGYDPDKPINAYPSCGVLNQRREDCGWSGSDDSRLWFLYDSEARRHIKAHYALKNTIAEVAEQ